MHLLYIYILLYTKHRFSKNSVNDQTQFRCNVLSGTAGPQSKSWPVATICRARWRKTHRLHAFTTFHSFQKDDRGHTFHLSTIANRRQAHGKGNPPRHLHMANSPVNRRSTFRAVRRTSPKDAYIQKKNYGTTSIHRIF